MTKLRPFITVFLFFYAINIFSQKEANIWYFGDNAGLDFNTSPPTALTNGQISTDEGCSSFSDENGNLLFYSDGISVYNKNHSLMTYINGDLANDLKGNPSSTQSGMIIPKPNSSSIYYLFTVGTDFVPNGIVANPGFNYYTIDMSLNSGLGQITEGPINLAINPDTGIDISHSWSEKVTAVKGKECNTFWVLSFVNDTFYAYKVNKDGVDINNVVTSRVNYNSLDKRGYLQVSPDGKKIAFADFYLLNNGQNTTLNGGLVLFDFNDETGIVNSSPETLVGQNTNESPYGVAFSQQSNKLYASFYDGDFAIYQYDLESSDIEQSKTLIALKRNEFRGALQLAPNGKIYASIPDSEFLDAIENPNQNAEDVIYTEDAIYLGGNLTTQGLPPFVSSLLLPLDIIDTANNQIITNEDLQYCIGESISLSSENITGTNITYNWTFDDGNTVSAILPSGPILNLNNLTTTNNGIYKLTVTLEDECGNIKTFEGSFNIGVFEPTTANKPNDISLCDSDGFNEFDFNNITSQVLASQNANQFDVLFYLDENDAINNINNLTIPYTNTVAFTSEDIYVRIHNTDAPDACFDITNFNLSVIEIPQPTQPLDYIVCDDLVSGSDTDGLYNNFILSSKDSEILGDLDASKFNISYHTSLLGAQTSNSTAVINKNSYQNTDTNEQLIYVRIENIKNTDCFVVSENDSDTFSPFSLIVNPLPTINDFTQLTQCDTDADLSTTINLTLSEKNIVTNSTNETFSYYPTENDAILGTSEIINKTTYLTNNNDTVWVRVISDQGCFRISELNIIISNTPTISYTNNFITCDDEFDNDGNSSDKDGIAYFNISSVVDDILNSFTNPNDLEVLIFETIANRDAVENEITDLINYRNTNKPALTSQELYIKVLNKNNNNCVGLGNFTIATNPLPAFNITTPQIFCLNYSPLTIEVENPEDIYTYQWTKDDNTAIIGTKTTLDITSAGAYHITATNNTTNCTRTQTIITNESSIATINNNSFTIIEDSNNNSISINEQTLGSGNYEYSLLNEEQTNTIRDYQDEPYFDNLEGGIYTLLIQDKNNCGVIEYQFSIIEFPKFLTPNGDSYNDTWNVKGINTAFYPKSDIFIFDRYGKNIGNISIDSNGWDGTFNGQQLPPNDYWYNVELTDNEGNIKIKKGHFSLLRN